MIEEVTRETIDQAAEIHAESWKASHRAFCSREFVEAHTPMRQKAYLLEKMERGSRIFLLTEGEPVGLVSVTENRIEDLYVLPRLQNRGYGSRLLRFAMARCSGRPVLWILENNEGARRLYERFGFRATGRSNRLSETLSELEFAASGEVRRGVT